MNEFSVTAGDEELTYIRQIAREMTSAFGIDPDEATGRIRRFWGGQEFVSEHAAGAVASDGRRLGAPDLLRRAAVVARRAAARAGALPVAVTAAG